METQTRIRSNEELYGDLELIPLPVEPIQQRIDFFEGKVKETMHGDQFEFYKYYKAWEHWKQIKQEHCLEE